MVSTRLMSIFEGNRVAACNSSVGNQSSQNDANGPPPAKIPRYQSLTSNEPRSSTVVENLPETSRGCAPPRSPPQQTIHFLDLPQEVIEKILSYLTFKNIAHLRPVCHTMDHICGSILNSTFQKLQKQMLVRFQNIKAKMPRRESARRNHPLACESDIIETLHMRLTLLQMSFGKHIERRHCCFFAGEVLDEVYRILNYIKKTTKLQRPYKVTDELFDLSSMAMEYFKEHIEPRLPEIAYFTSDFLDLTGSTFTSSSNSKNFLCLDSSPLGAGSGSEQKGDETPIHTAAEPAEQSYISVDPIPQSNMVLRKRIRKIKQGMKRYNSQLSLLRQDLRTCKRKTAEQQKQIAEQQRQLAEQQKQTLEYVARLDENDKKNEETSRKFSTLLQELNKCKTELQYWRSKSPAMPPVCKGCGAVFTPVPQEDIQILVNQGIRPEGLGILIEDSFSSNTTEENTATTAEFINTQKPAPSENIEAVVPVEISSPSPPQCTKQQGIKRKITQENTAPVVEPSTTAEPAETITQSPATSDTKKNRRYSKTRTKRVKAIQGSCQ